MYSTWLTELGEAGIRQIIFTGGEPTIHKALPELLTMAKQRYQMRVMLQTNATRLGQPAYLQRIIDTGLDRLFVSLHAADEHISDQMTRAPKTFRLTIRGIKAALKAGFRVGLNCVVEKANYQNLAEHARFIVQNFVDPFPHNPIESVNYSRPQSYYDRALWMNSLVSMDAIEPFLLEAIRILDDAGIILDITAGSCGLPACILRSRPDLIHLPQSQHIGMADPSFHNHGREQYACQRCALAARCQGPGSGYLQRFGDLGLVPFVTMPPVASNFPVSL